MKPSIRSGILQNFACQGYRKLGLPFLNLVLSCMNSAKQVENVFHVAEEIMSALYKI
jgi:hypothetical protein